MMPNNSWNREDYNKSTTNNNNGNWNGNPKPNRNERHSESSQTRNHRVSSEGCGGGGGGRGYSSNRNRGGDDRTGHGRDTGYDKYDRGNGNYDRDHEPNHDRDRGRGHEPNYERGDDEYGRGHNDRRYDYGPRDGARQHDSRRSNQREEGWRCAECRTWNAYDDMDSCGECRWRRPRESRRDHRERSRSPHRRDDHRPLPPKVMKREWPPCFDSAGASYVFDTRSGFFYEATSDFFYDPKSKMYYSNKKQAYFEYVEGQNPPYRPFTPKSKKLSLGAEDEENDAECKQPDGETKEEQKEAGAAPAEKKIKISLKTKTISSTAEVPSATKPSTTVVKLDVTMKASAIATPIIQKKHAVDMVKWSERAREKTVENHSSTSPSNVANSQMADTPENPTICTTTTATATTSAGKPVCLLCKRKFATMDKLQQHINLSSLHKKNLEKQQASNNTQNYRDRARERRHMYHTPETKEVDITNNIPSLSEARQVTHTETQNVLAQGNIGNAIFQKIAGNTFKPVKKGMEVQLRQEWNKIEIAGNTSKPVKKGIGF